MPAPGRLVLALACAAFAPGAIAQTSPMAPDISGKPFLAPTADNDYVKREVMIPMRDGVKLHTVIVIPKGARHAPILFTRTPYDASGRTQRNVSTRMKDLLQEGDDVFVEGGYIRVFQDVRGKYGSEGDYVMTRPLRGPLNPTPVDHSTDAYDTIDWLVKHLPESNGKVGMIGSSYEGFAVVMALVNPHPALKVAAPESPMVDGWMGDDWFNNGAFRQINFGYFLGQTTARGKGASLPDTGQDDYARFLAAGSAGDFARRSGIDQLTWWHKLTEHPAYDAYWQQQALDKVMARTPLTVPTMWLQGLWDQEDMYGANHSYAAMEGQDTSNTMNYLVMGPWRHSQVNASGERLGPLQFDGDTAAQFRRQVLRPFFDQYLVDGAPRADTPPVFIYDTGRNQWERLASWPRSCQGGCPGKSTPLYLHAGGALSFEAPKAGQGDYAEYVSDPAKPVPFAPRPLRFDDRAMWTTWLVTDQRFVDGRPDVLSFVTAPLDAPVHIAGVPAVHLQASTSGTDSDWVVKLIDVYPEAGAGTPALAGIELPVGISIFRGRYRERFDAPAPLAAGQPLAYRFDLPNANHTFAKGHRIMVQVQSTLFPLYDRNPQRYVPTIFSAQPGDYIRATQRVWTSPQQASFIELPVIDAMH